MHRLLSRSIYMRSMHELKSLTRAHTNNFHSLNRNNIYKPCKGWLNIFKPYSFPQCRNLSFFNWNRGNKNDDGEITNTKLSSENNSQNKGYSIEVVDENLKKAIEISGTPDVYKYLPIADHPLVPNYPIHLSVTKNQFTVRDILYLMPSRNLHNISKHLK